jgi:hypothetical protein
MVVGYGCRLTYTINYVPVVLKKAAIMPSFGNILGASQVDIDRITMWLDNFGRFKDLLRIIAAKLRPHQIPR